jgi:hypothetical protein
MLDMQKIHHPVFEFELRTSKYRAELYRAAVLATLEVATHRITLILNIQLSSMLTHLSLVFVFSKQAG